ncbi:PREDICTED: anaphase-promoting complex subunit 13 [Tinamus guttatus]|uniref:anaphase-promoting complex subunit 13 n=1 Tax=Tinamus guttatus TaxID=94827 RepID=UPI00052EB9EA|nr:PREDICTED: anaphase-promoting complex subunit 13 [Tinamus guttatus]
MGPEQQYAPVTPRALPRGGSSALAANELPEPEQDNGGTTESVKEQEMKWTDLALQYLHENVPPTGN